MFLVSDWLIIMIGRVVSYSPICCPNFDFITAQKQKKQKKKKKKTWI
jgi:hypothetical protein